mmetsp:Transcript_62067/g.166548  ORF Transcript_62067/g.166548 Transcript_62067/m.166548 type:complete len:223 (-) Transcript_62067:155-823(-)
MPPILRTGRVRWVLWFTCTVPSGSTRTTCVPLMSTSRALALPPCMHATRRSWWASSIRMLSSTEYGHHSSSNLHSHTQPSTRRIGSISLVSRLVRVMLLTSSRKSTDHARAHTCIGSPPTPPPTRPGLPAADAPGPRGAGLSTASRAWYCFSRKKDVRPGKSSHSALPDLSRTAASPGGLANICHLTEHVLCLTRPVRTAFSTKTRAIRPGPTWTTLLGQLA